MSNEEKWEEFEREEAKEDGERLTRGVLTLIFTGIITILFSFKCILAQSYIEVSIEGISDGIKNSIQKDYWEAVMDAKLKAIEQSGVSIKSYDLVENFMLKQSIIEAKSEGLLMPGYKVIKIGYGVDGAFHVVLTGKVKIGSITNESFSDDIGYREFNYALKLEQQNRSDEAIEVMNRIISEFPNSVKADDAYWYLSKLDIKEFRYKDGFDKIARIQAYYPHSNLLIEIPNEIELIFDEILIKTDYSKEILSYYNNKIVTFQRWANLTLENPTLSKSFEVKINSAVSEWKKKPFNIGTPAKRLKHYLLQ